MRSLSLEMARRKRRSIKRMLATTKQPEHNFNSDDYYEVLGADRDSSQEYIRAAYRKLANKFHPDKEEGDDERFKLIQEAFEMLSDPIKRKQYDEFGRFTAEQVNEVKSYVASIVDQIINNEQVDLAYVDVVETLRKTTLQNVQTAKTQLKSQERKKKRIEKNEHRTKNDAISGVFSKHKGLAIKKIEELKNNIKMFEISLSMIENYEYIFDERPQVTIRRDSAGYITSVAD